MKLPNEVKVGIVLGLLFVVGVALITLVRAETISVTIQSLPPVRQGSNVTLIQNCVNDTGYCTACNITSVAYPDSTFLIKQKAMTSQGQGNFNYTLLLPQNSPVGDYIANGFCTDGTNFVTWAYRIPVTSTGYQTNIIWITLLVFSFVFLFTYISTREHFFGVMSGMLFLTSSVYIMIFGMINVNDVYSRSIAYVCMGIGVLFTIASAYNWASDDGGSES